MDKETKIPILNKVKNRLLNLSPTVKECLEPECKSNDFYRDGNKSVGKGAFGEVWKVTHKISNQVYVIKVIDKAYIIEQKMINQMNREIEIMYKLDHPHLVKLVNHFEDDTNFYLILHFASKGQLYKLLNKVTRFDQRTAAQYIREVVEALRYCHSHDPPVIHRDIKPENILLDENNRIKVADFGWSNFGAEDEDRKTYCGTPDYLSPEMIKRQGHDKMVDVWSVGVLIFELLAGYAPFSGHTQEEKFQNIVKLKINWPNDFPPLAKNLVSKILKPNPKERIGLDDIINHAWFEKNPPIKAIMVTSNLDAKKKLESHLIQVKSENINEQINQIVDSSKLKRASIIEKARQESNTSNSNSEQYKSMIQKLESEKETILKENELLKSKFDKSEIEIKALKQENIKLRETIATQTPIEEINRMREEIEKSKIVNKERLDLLSEIEEKNNEISEHKNKISNLYNELNNTVKTNEINIEKINELNKNIENFENKMMESRQRENSLNKEIEDTKMQFNKKIEILQNKIIDSASEDPANLENSLIKIIEILNESIDETKQVFKTKTTNLFSILLEIKDQCNKAEEDLTFQLRERNSQILEVMSKIKSNAASQDSRQSLIRMDSNSSEKKGHDIIDWLKKQISELQPYKNKVIACEIRINQLESSVKNLTSNLELQKGNVANIEKLVQMKDVKIKEMQNYADNLEAKLSDVKDFVFKNCGDKLDDFISCFKNHYKL